MCVTATLEGSRAKIDPLWSERSGALFVLFETIDLRSDLASTTTDGISPEITKTINAQHPCRKLEKLLTWNRFPALKCGRSSALL
jgi:hypothetical protein